MTYEMIWNLNYSFLKPTAKVYSQNHLFRTLRKGCLAWYLLVEV